jgi:RNA polymerase sigma factor (TIGR02999 family)
MESKEQNVTQFLHAYQDGEPLGTERFFAAIYQELRHLASAKMAREAPGHTLQPTALVHEVWLRLARDQEQAFQNRAHFFGAASEAMRRILVEHARRKQTGKRGARPEREELTEDSIVLSVPADELLAVHDALEELGAKDQLAAELVKLRYFVGMSMEEAAASLDLSPRTAERTWTFARAWLHREIRRSQGNNRSSANLSPK